MKIKAVIHLAEEGGYGAEVPALTGCITEGETKDEVIDNLRDAIEGWLDVANERQVTQSTEQDAKLEGVKDPEVLVISACNSRLLVTHDRKTMPIEYRTLET